MYEDALNAAQYGFARRIRSRASLELRLVGLVRRVAEVHERRGEELALAVEHRHLALELLEVLRLEDQRPRVGRQPELLQLLDVVADQRDRVRVGHRVAVARIEEQVEELGLDVVEALDLRVVELAQRALRDQRLDRVAGRHQDVVAGRAGRELGEQLLVVRVVVLHELALARRLERLRGLLGEVVVPVVEVQLVAARSAAFGALSVSPPCLVGRRPAGGERRAQRRRARRRAGDGGAGHRHVSLAAQRVGRDLAGDDDQGQRQQHQQRRQRVDLGRHRDLDHRVDRQRQRRHAGARR